jgi:hypothetical protein
MGSFRKTFKDYYYYYFMIRQKYESNFKYFVG